MVFLPTTKYIRMHQIIAWVLMGGLTLHSIMILTHSLEHAPSTVQRCTVYTVAYIYKLLSNHFNSHAYNNQKPKEKCFLVVHTERI